MTEAPLTELDHKLREMALTNWAQFVQFIGKDAITSAKVCLLRQRQQSYQQISIKLSISEKQARYACDKCKTKQPAKN
jgi:hypothetical protein